MLIGLLVLFALTACTEAPSPDISTPAVLPPSAFDPAFIATASARNKLPGISFNIFAIEIRNYNGTQVASYAQNDPVAYSFSTEQDKQAIYRDSCNVADVYLYKDTMRRFERVASQNQCGALGQPVAVPPTEPFRSRILPEKLGLVPGLYQLGMDFYTNCPRGSTTVAQCGNGIPSNVRSIPFVVTDEHRITPTPNSVTTTPKP